MLKIRVVIADDHPLVIMGIRELLEQDIHTSVEAAVLSPSELVKQLERTLPDVVITDYNMPDDKQYGDGIQFISYLLRRFDGLKVIILTMLSNPMIISSLYDAGVQGVVLKQHKLTEILKALHMTRLGVKYYPPGYTEKKQAEKGGPIEERLASLTPREFEVLRRFAQGQTIGEIAEQLNRSIKTVSTQKTAAMRKLDVQSNQDLIAFCVHNGTFLN